MDKDDLKNPTCSLTVQFFKETGNALIFVDGINETEFVKNMPLVLVGLLSGKLDKAIEDSINNKFGSKLGEKIMNLTINHIKDINEHQIKLSKEIILKILEEPLKLASQSWKESRDEGDYNDIN